jgi:hypothetical protein
MTPERLRLLGAAIAFVGLVTLVVVANQTTGWLNLGLMLLGLLGLIGLLALYNRKYR